MVQAIVLAAQITYQVLFGATTTSVTSTGTTVGPTQTGAIVVVDTLEMN